MSAAPVLVWFRDDLRLADHPALHAAAATGRPVLAAYVLDEPPGRPPLGAAARWWLAGSLSALAAALERRGLTLALRRGDAGEIIPRLAAETGADWVLWNRCYDPAVVPRDTALKRALTERGIRAESFDGSLLQSPTRLKTQAGGPFLVFTPFWRACRALPQEPPLPVPDRLVPAAARPASDALADWRLAPTRPDWAGGLRAAWQPGEAAAQARLAAFLDGSLGDYAARRDRPDLPATSRLSPALRWGELSPRQVWQAALHEAARTGASAEKFLAELGWREFSHHLLFHHPDLPRQPLRPAFARFPWAPDSGLLAAWQQGRTGYPIVDAGMRELWHTGWMHNRVRMIAASFLTKHLLQPWTDGAAWFHDTLVDADPASNSASWQWVAGCGADAAPYFRLFNPVLQGQKFDPEGAYVRRWLPELAGRPTDRIHAPRGIREPGLGDYPPPLVEHAAARERALAAYAAMRRAGGA